MSTHRRERGRIAEWIALQAKLFGSDPPLEEDMRRRLAQTMVQWVFFPAVALTMLGMLTVVATVGFSEPTRFIPLVLFAAPCMVACKMRRAKRWIPSAGALCTAAMLHVVSGVLFNSVRAPVYGAGVLVLTLIVTLFGLRWGVLAALSLIAAGATWLVLDAHGIAAAVAIPTAGVMYGLYVGMFVLGLALASAPQLLLSDALREAKRKHQEAEDARAATAASELAFHAVFDQASVALALLTSDGRVTQLNPRAAEFLGGELGAPIGSHLPVASRWSEPQRELLQRAVQEAALGHRSQHELSCERRGGVPQTWQLVLSPFCAPNGRVEHVLVEIVDVSDMVETRSMLAQARRLEALGQLSGGVAHDLNNMLTAILSACELTRLARGDVRKINENVGLIQASVQRAASLTKQLLAFGRKDRWNSEFLDASQLLREVARLLERTLNKNIDIVVLADTPSHVRADAAALEHALLNLALNAQAAMPDGGTLTLACRSIVLEDAVCRHLDGELPPGPAVVLSVEDTGTGMSADVRERIFEPFFTTKAVGEGTGLGLAAVHGTVRGHRGALAVSSELGVGTRIALFFPAAQGSAEPAPAPARHDNTQPLLLKHARVLLADDEALARDTVVALLESAGCHVASVRDGTALIETLAAGAMPDVIVSDLAMPGLGGVKLVQTIEALRPDCALLLITGFSGDDVSIACPPRSRRRLLRKPFLRAELLRALNELLTQAQPQPFVEQSADVPSA